MRHCHRYRARRTAAVEADGPAGLLKGSKAMAAILAEIADYDDLWRGIRGRVDAMGITREELDHLSGLQEGYSGKTLGPKQRKKFGNVSLGSTLGAIGCNFS
jgi:hypothetical protein